MFPVRALPIAAAAGLLAAAPAGARTVELGAVAPAGASGPSCGGGCTHFQVAGGASGPPYLVRERGVISSWRVRGGPNVAAGDRARLRVLRPGPSSGSWVVASQSAEEAPAAGQVTSFSTRIPVAAGERLGLRVAGSGDTPATYGGPPDAVTGTWLGDPAPGADPGAPMTTEGRRVNVAVRLESDFDGDGFGDDTQDFDDDGDGMADERELELGSDPLRRDSDGDGVRDGRDTCVLTPDPAQLDADGDRVGDVCDSDDDEDTLSDDVERFLRTRTMDADTDDDGISDGEEERIHTDPRHRDTDRDGIPDGVETGVRRPVADPPGRAAGTLRSRFRPDRDPRTRTDPLRADTDRDGRPDGREDRNRNGRRDRGETDPTRRNVFG